jgi:hypothetical protein
MLVNPRQLAKTLLANAFTPEGIVTLVRPLQYWNANVPMLVMVAGRVTLFSPLQLENAPVGMLVKLAGIATPVSPLQ